MKIGVLIKQVPDTEAKIRIKPDKSGIEEAGIKFVINPYDEFAVEEALKTREKAGGETVAVSLGPDRVVESIRTALAMGIDKGIHVGSEGNVFDSFATARVLANVIKAGGFDVIFCGKQAIDGDNAQTASMIAELLNIPQVMVVEKFELTEDKKGAIATRVVGGGAREVYEVGFPAIFGCEKGLNTPRYASLPGIMKAKSKPIEKLKASDFIQGESTLVRFTDFELPPERSAGKKIAGEPVQQAAELVRLLREEVKVI